MLDGSNNQNYNGRITTYIRTYTTAAYTNYSYLSPFIAHILLKLKPSTKYYYRVSIPMPPEIAVPAYAHA